MELLWGRRSIDDLDALWQVGDEGDALDLALVVESDDTDEGVRVSLDRLVELLDHLDGVGAPVHGQLPHCPVPSVIVSGRVVVLSVHEPVLDFEFQAGNPSVPDKVLNLLDQLLPGQWGKVGQCLKLLQTLWWPHIEALDFAAVASQRGDVSWFLGGGGEGGGGLESVVGGHGACLSWGGAAGGASGGHCGGEHCGGHFSSSL